MRLFRRPTNSLFIEEEYNWMKSRSTAAGKFKVFFTTLILCGGVSLIFFSAG